MDPETGRIKVYWELIAGGTAGGCQVVCEQLHCSYLMRSNQPSVITDIHQPS